MTRRSLTIASLMIHDRVTKRKTAVSMCQQLDHVGPTAIRQALWVILFECRGAMATAALGQNGFPGGRFSEMLMMLVGYPGVSCKQAAAEYAVLQSEEIRGRT